MITPLKKQLILLGISSYGLGLSSMFLIFIKKEENILLSFTTILFFLFFLIKINQKYNLILRGDLK